MTRTLFVVAALLTTACSPKKKTPTVRTARPYAAALPSGVSPSQQRLTALADLDSVWVDRTRKAGMLEGKKALCRIRTPGATGPATPANTQFILVTLGDRSGSQGVDTDRDGLSDEAEALIGTDPALADTDGDTIPDGFETFGTGTLPERADSDGDGVPDDVELNLDDVETYSDTDGDGLLNGQERAFFSSKVDALDSDRDGFGDDYEYYFATAMDDADHPTSDEDGDGQPDDFEVANGFDPNDASSGLADADGDALPDFVDEDDMAAHAMIEGRLGRRAGVPANSPDCNTNAGNVNR
jgi:Bacterial TSP3 repeat